MADRRKAFATLPHMVYRITQNLVTTKPKIHKVKIRIQIARMMHSNRSKLAYNSSPCCLDFHNYLPVENSYQVPQVNGQLTVPYRRTGITNV